MLETALFIILSSLLLGSATMLISAKSLVQSALWLVAAFISAAGLWILLNAEFVGLVLILVYVGAVLTLFLFVIMTLPELEATAVTSKRHTNYQLRYFNYLIIALGLLLYLVYQSTHNSYISSTAVRIEQPTSIASNTRTLGLQLYTQYAYPIELVGMLLLTAVIVSVSISHNNPTLTSKTNLLKNKFKNHIQLSRGT